MIIGIGIDLVEVSRIALALSRWGSKFENRVFSEKEMFYCNSKKDRAQRLACRFAAKEALLKALGIGWRYGTDWKEIEVINDELGKPSICLSGRTEEFSQQMGVKNILLSITSTENYGAAQVILVSE
jgi:holo-[acyl-carrier protein] synthase